MFRNKCVKEEDNTKDMYVKTAENVKCWASEASANVVV